MRSDRSSDRHCCQLLLSLLLLPGIGRGSVRRILADLESLPEDPDQLLEMVARSDLMSSVRPDIEQCSDAWQVSIKLLESLRAKNLEVIPFSSSRFPESLQQIEDAPALLFVRGSVDVLQRHCIAVIGSRSTDGFGQEMARSVGRHCAAAGYPVVSGLAAGCDTAAHLGCLDGGEPTVAILAHGLDHVFPPENSSLADQIVAQGGALVSEYLPDQEPDSDQFIERDRLQSGLSHGVIFIQSELQGGAMHTVQFARQQQRPIAVIAAVENDVSGELYAGNRRLIDEGDVLPISRLTDLDRFLLEHQTG
ncbi:MAG: DNA-processing protein DprA [Planctomycetota bacterium]|nr:DNA-processing protein DprA [Planctomycetota bacterium]